MTNQEAHEQLILWLHDLLNIVVIKDRQQAERPARPYVMVDLANWQNRDDNPTDLIYTELDTENSEGFKEVALSPVVEMEWVFLVFAYGEESQALLRRVQSAMLIREAQTSLLGEGLVIHSISGANDVPELIDEKWEPRAQLNIVLHGVSGGDEAGIVIDVIETPEFDITGERA